MTTLSRRSNALVHGVFLTLGCAVLFVHTNVFAQKKLSSVADLRYGVSLYHYYQNENLQALSELMVAQSRGGVKGHGDNPEIMEGGFSMAYGMERKAAEIFNRLLDENRPQQTRDAAWFYLARMRYLRGDWPAAEEALAQLSKDPAQSLLPELGLLRFNLAVRQNRLEEAQALADSGFIRNASWPYMQFNLGSAFARNRLHVRGVEAFTKLEDLDQTDAEHLALYDKAMTAAGYSYLLQKKYPEAIRYFTSVRLDSPMSNRALLGYGWAAVENEDYALALKPWQALSKRSLVDENTQEVLIAIPYAYEKMGYQSLALKEFRTAESSYLTEIARLDEVIKNVQGYAIREALAIERSEDFDWLNYAERSELSPQISYLIPLFSKETFIGLVQELRDLLAIQDQYTEWQKKLQFYKAMLDERELNRTNEMSYIEQQGLADKIAALTERRDAFAEQLAQISQANDIAALLSPEDSPKMERLLRAESNVRLLQNALNNGIEIMPREELQELAETVRRLKGSMVWQAVDLFDERYWRVKKGLAEVNQTLRSMEGTQSRVRNIVDQGFDLTPYRKRIAEAEEQLLNQTVDIEMAVQRSQDALRSQVLDILAQQRERLYHYLAQSRLSIARLLDSTSEDRATSKPSAEAQQDTPSETEDASQGAEQ